ncbi:MAG: hypothetical protein K2Z81_07675 [Cyanobacteria bacterium]|nr:hypothetical protein [Cyanobacteriota bacterium]
MRTLVLPRMGMIESMVKVSKRETNAFIGILSALTLASSMNVITAPRAFAGAWGECQNPVLMGLKKVTVVVNARGDGVKRLGLKQDALKTDVENQLKRNGIAIEPFGSLRDKPDTGALQIDTHLTVIQAPNGNPLGITYAVDGFLLDPVTSARRPLSMSTLGILWKSTGTYGYLNSSHIGKFANAVHAVVDEFSKDWKVANVPGTIPVSQAPAAPAQPAGKNVNVHTEAALSEQKAIIQQQQAVIAQQKVAMAKQHQYLAQKNAIAAKKKAKQQGMAEEQTSNAPMVQQYGKSKHVVTF